MESSSHCYSILVGEIFLVGLQVHFLVYFHVIDETFLHYWVLVPLDDVFLAQTDYCHPARFSSVCRKFVILVPHEVYFVSVRVGFCCLTRHAAACKQEVSFARSRFRVLKMEFLSVCRENTSRSL